MTKAKTTKRALLVSALSMLLCVAMLVGSTYAWFTDSVTSGKNKIVAGNLDVELEYCVDPSAEEADWNFVEGAEDLFGDIALWEPGTTGVVYFRLSNLGTLALKYKLAMNFTDTVIGKNADGGDIKLSEILEFGIVEGQKETFESREAAIAAVPGAKKVNEGFTDGKPMGVTDKKTYFALVVYMPTAVGNEANYKTGTDAPAIDLGVTLLATQDTVESDSFGKDYDKNAWSEMNIYPNGDGTYSDGENTYVEVDNKYIKVIADETIEGLYSAENGDKYTTTAAAFTAAANAGGNITPLADIEAEYKNTTFEYNGTIYSIDNTEKFLNITADANIDLDDKIITIDSESGKNGIKGAKNVTLAFSDGTIEQSKSAGSSYPVIGAEKGTVVLSNVTVECKDKSGAVVSAGSDGGVLELYNSTIIGGDATGRYAVFCGSKSSVWIDGGTVVGRITAMLNATIEINGGDYTQATFDSQSKNNIIIYNGLFNFDPSDSTEVMLAGDTTYVTDNGNGTWSVATLDEGDFEDPFGE